MATAPHGARLAVGSFPRLLRGHVNRLACLAKAAFCGRGAHDGHLGAAGSPTSLHAGSPCRFLRCTVWRMRGAATGFACSTLNPSTRHLLSLQIFEAPSVMSSRDKAMWTPLIMSAVWSWSPFVRKNYLGHRRVQSVSRCLRVVSSRFELRVARPAQASS